MQHNSHRNYPYSRGSLLHNGLLVDVSEIAQHENIPYPVAVSAALAKELEPNQFLSTFGINFTERVANLLKIVKGHFIPRRGGIEDLPDDQIIFPYVVLRGPLIHEDLISVVAIIHEGDDGEPVITISSLTEDKAAA